MLIKGFYQDYIREQKGSQKIRVYRKIRGDMLILTSDNPNYPYITVKDKQAKKNIRSMGIEKYVLYLSTTRASFSRDMVIIWDLYHAGYKLRVL